MKHAFRVRWTWGRLALWSLLVCGGCDAESDANPPIDDSTVVDAGTHLAELGQVHLELAEILKTVTDEQSARAALPKLQQISDNNLAGARLARAIQLGRHGPNYKAQEAEWLAAHGAFKAEMDRIQAQSPPAYQVLLPFFLQGSEE